MPPATLIEEIRFGYGPDPLAGVPGPGLDPQRLLDQLARSVKPTPRDLILAADRLALLEQQSAASKAAKMGGPNENPAKEVLKRLSTEDAVDWVWDGVLTQTPFSERLVNFWANRLTVAYRNGAVASLLGPYRETAIRPHIAGRFADMLAASAWHPTMLEYLDQAASVGPKSKMGQRKRRGLNENYAREFLELHTMASGYTQADVTELARLFAGMQYRAEGAYFEEGAAEPGPKQVLGESYESGPDEIARLIETVARKPETATSIAHALAQHFIADDPPQDLVEAMAQAYLDHDTALMPVYSALLHHPSAADPVFRKFRRPQEYMIATLRVLGVGLELSTGKGRLRIGQILEDMGQPPLRAPGPDGWPDRVEDWLAAPSLAARLAWAEIAARRFARNTEPGPLARAVLGDGEEATLTAVTRAEQRWEGVAVLLSCPAMMRR